MKRPLYIGSFVLALALAYASGQTSTTPPPAGNTAGQATQEKTESPAAQTPTGHEQSGAHQGHGQMGHEKSAAHQGKRSVADEKLHKEVHKALKQQNQGELAKVKVDVRDGVARLFGSVRSEDQKRRAEELARTVSGITSVTNELTAASATGSSTATPTSAPTSGTVDQSGSVGTTAGTPGTTTQAVGSGSAGVDTDDPSGATTGSAAATTTDPAATQSTTTQTTAGSIVGNTTATTGAQTTTTPAGTTTQSSQQVPSSTTTATGTQSTTTGVVSGTGNVSGQSTTTTSPTVNAPSTTGTSGVTAGTTGTATTGATGSTSNTGSFGTDAASADLESRIEQALRNEPTLSGSSVDVNVTEATIEISGTVPTGKERQTAKRITQSYAGNRRVNDRLTVSGRNDGMAGSGSAGVDSDKANKDKKGTTTPPPPPPKQ